MIHTLSQAQEAIALLKKLIAIPSFSKQEDKTGDCIANFLEEKGIPFQRVKNNIWATNKYFDSQKPTILLNSHHDTVKPNASYTLDPFDPIEKDGRLYGLGSNDAGGCLVSLISTFLHFYDKSELKYNFVLATTAEEEISGREGLEMIIPHLPPIDFAIVGEPTQMQMAVAEKGLLVVDCVTRGKAGHAARNEGENAIYKAMRDIEWIRNYEFPEVSEMLGPIKMTVTIIQAGSQHNVVPDTCTFTVDVRTTDKYSNEDVLLVLKNGLLSEVNARSVRLKPSSIPLNHPIVEAGKSLGLTTYGSPTTSDQALLDVPSLKMGPGDSARSHSADEFIYLEEIEKGIERYIEILEKIV
ncbi:M20 family metallo-hydrolase [Cytophagaceae bacterium DM2B3-1]|uniref:M20 family metallo-hydrolase n=1 Tax=Xanthocytophaga flava TaxID=3048013 RepID=A0ABT7CCS1_9BACT|nr:M20 family metallo-hydrolase [Xanthocytophaga flavus]MDJ1470028.1 M20 family metallo-hydrolase [Xanthocytophaga flavus]MDJ1491408.1 M20 family metallo-hydrolase [Xanthocytophaga flavus]